jgi:ketosteroid isomerase-like protein
VATAAEIIAAMGDEWNAHDLDAVYARLADDYREFANGTLVKVGRDEARRADQILYDMLPDYRRTVEETWGTDDRAVSRFTIHGSTRDGRHVAIAVVGIYGVRDGKINEAHMFFDPASGVPVP